MDVAIFFSKQNMSTDVCVFFEYRKKSDNGFDKSFTIKCNKNKDIWKTNRIEIKGTCCWKIVNRNGDSQDITPGVNQRNTLPYISKLKTKKCQDSPKGSETSETSVSSALLGYKNSHEKVLTFLLCQFFLFL